MFGKLNDFLGSNTGGALADFGLSQLGASLQGKRGRRQWSWQFRQLQEAGLTPWEIAGNGGSAPSSAGAPSTLGNGSSLASAAMQRQQQSFEANERAKDRARDLQVATIQADAPSRQAAVAEGQLDLARVNSAVDRALKVSQIAVNQQRRVQVEADTAKVLQDTRFQRILHRERWARLFASMGPENVAASVMAVLHGVNTKAALQGLPLSVAEQESARAFLDEVQGFRSRFASEAQGGASVVVDILETLFSDEPDFTHDLDEINRRHHSNRRSDQGGRRLGNRPSGPDRHMVLGGGPPRVRSERQARLDRLR